MRLSESLCCFYFVLQCVCAFNFFPKYAQIFSNNVPGSYFGYSILLQAEISNNPARIIVGSPRANSTSTNILRSLNEPGAVYNCPINEKTCKQFLLSLQGNEEGRIGTFKYHSRRDNSWLGAAIDGLDVARGRLVACAPRWINQYHQRLYYLQNGACYSLEDSTNTDKIAQVLLPLISEVNQGKRRESTNENVYYYALGEAGMSVHLAKDNTELLFGAPGLKQWRGMVGRYNTMNFNRSANIQDPDTVQYLNDFSYFGYSLSSGKFGEQNRTWYVGGAPRGQNLFGQVFIFDYVNGIEIYYKMAGQQEGEYFGSSLSVGDFNGDGFDDVIVGSPMYSTENYYDVGCAYVYINNYVKERSFQRTILYPPMPKNGMRFGTAVQAIGDLNKDGFQDVAIGAPYEEKGVVYIYLGSSSGISEHYSQRIVASEISPSLQGFGSSFSRGVDIDKNNYIDLAIGSYLSNQAVLLKSRPVVSIYPLLKSNRSQISINVRSFKISACMKYTGEDLPGTLNIKTLITADDFYKRVNFKESRGMSWEIMKENRYNYNEEKCEEYEILVVNTQSDFTQPIIFTMTYELIERPEDGFCAECPVVDKKLPNHAELRISYETGCNEICKPNLKLNVTHDKYLVIGAQEKTDISIKIENLAQPAFGCRLYAEIPSFVTFVRVPENCQNANNNLLMCDMGNPVKQNDMKSLTLPIDVSMLGTQESLIVKLITNSSGEEVDIRDNSVILEIPLKTEVSISVIGISNPEQYNFIEQGKLKQSNLTFTQQYTVQNLGPSPLNDLELTFLIPQSFGPGEKNVVSVYAPETYSDGTTISCKLYSSSEGYIGDKPTLPQNEAEEPSPASSTSRLRREVARADTRPEDGSQEVEEMNLPLDNPAIYTRVQKLIASDRALPEGLQENRTLALGPRDDVQSMEVRCTSGLLKKNSRAVIGFKMVADLTVLDEKRGDKDTIVITSSVQPKSQYFTVNKTYTHTILQGNARPGSSWQWIILGLILGIILLTLIIFGLYKAGFFKRKTPVEESVEEMTLTTN